MLKGRAHYFHFFWIPVIPLRKELYVKCIDCHNTVAKENFPEDIKKAVQQEKIRRPIWHLIAPIFILYKLVSAILFFGSAYVEEVMQEAKYEEEKAAEAVRVEQRKEVFANDKQSIQLTPSFATDSISYTIKEEFQFSEYHLNTDQVALLSKIEDHKLLLLIDVKETGKLKGAEGCVLVSQIKNFLIQKYPKKYYDYFIALYENDNLKLLHTPAEAYKTEYKSPTPLYGFYANDWYYEKSEDVFKNKQEKLQLFADYGKKDEKIAAVDLVKEEKAWEKMRAKFRFSYSSRPANEERRGLYECKFTLETGNILPDELRRMFKRHDGNGPFLNWNFFYSKTKKSYARYEYATLDALTKKDEIDERLLPVYASPYWIPFYDDDTFSYAVDMLPGKKGHVGQIILVKPRMKPRYIAKNMTEFLKLFHDEKVPTSFEAWRN